MLSLNTEEFHSNKLYTSEILSIYVQNSETLKKKFNNDKEMELLLKIISSFRKIKSIDNERIEFVENLFDTICSIIFLDNSTFLKLDGIELLFFIIKDSKKFRKSAVKTLSFSLTDKNSVEYFYLKNGLKYIFPLFLLNEFEGIIIYF
jgi:beta-catenin-like protein 1